MSVCRISLHLMTGSRLCLTRSAMVLFTGRKREFLLRWRIHRMGHLHARVAVLQVQQNGFELLELQFALVLAWDLVTDACSKHNSVSLCPSSGCCSRNVLLSHFHAAGRPEAAVGVGRFLPCLLSGCRRRCIAPALLDADAPFPFARAFSADCAAFCRTMEGGTMVCGSGMPVGCGALLAAAYGGVAALAGRSTCAMGAGGGGRRTGGGNRRQEPCSPMAYWKLPNSTLKASMAVCTEASCSTWSRSPRSA